jgi:hypothetical protein
VIVDVYSRKKQEREPSTALNIRKYRSQAEAEVVDRYIS